MKLRLIDYSDESKEVEIGDLKDIAVIEIKVVSGDEIAQVVYKDYTIEESDSSNIRFIDYYDGSYTVYNVKTGVNLLEDPKFKDRKTSYDFYHWE